MPGGSVALGILNRTGQEISTLITRAQAQRTLLGAMTAADTVVASIAEGLNEIYLAPNGAQHAIVTAVALDEENLLYNLAGGNRLTLYKGVAVDKAIAFVDIPASARFDTRLEHYFGNLVEKLGRQRPEDGICGMPDQSTLATGHCLTGAEVQSLEAMSNLLATIEPVYLTYQKDMANISRWRKAREAAAAHIVLAIGQWRTEHARLLAHFQSCGSFRALKPDCGNLTFANFKLAVDRLKIITSKGD